MRWFDLANFGVGKSRGRMRTRWSPVIVAGFLVGCGSAEQVLIGDAYPREAEQAAFLDSIEPAVESNGVWIARWTVTGTRLEALIQYQVEQATLFATDERVVAVVGHAGSREALLGAAVYNAHEVPNVVPNATSKRLARTGPWTFTLVPDDSVQGEFIANYALDSLHAARISVFYIGDEYGIGLRDGVQAALGRRQRDLSDATMVPSETCGKPAGRELFAPIVRAALRRAQPDALVITSGSANGWCVANFAHESNPATWILFSDGMDGARIIPPTATHIVPGRVRGVTFWEPRPDSINAAFVNRVQPSLGRQPTASQALQYDAFMLLAAAVREVGPNRLAIRNWLESLGRTRQPWIGVTGPIAFNRPRSEILRMTGPEEGER